MTQLAERVSILVTDELVTIPFAGGDEGDGHWITLGDGRHIFIQTGGQGQGQRSFSSDVVKAVQAKASDALANEQKVTPMLQGLASANQGQMIGLEHRLKTQDSLARKVADRAQQKGITPEQSAQQISDALRYTMQFPPDQLTQGVRSTEAALQKDGYKTAIDNFWVRGDSYNGLNGEVTDPKSGLKFELQFHTPDSYHVKEFVNHSDYEILRNSSKPDTERLAAFERMRATADALPLPRGVMTIGTPRLKPFKA